MMVVGLLLLSTSLHYRVLGSRISFKVDDSLATVKKEHFCTVKEKADHVQYGVQFSFYTPGSNKGCNRVKCSTFMFFEKILPQFFVPKMDKHRSHTCGCWLKQMTSDGPSKNQSLLFSFPVHHEFRAPKVSCTTEICWHKYSVASYLAKRVTDNATSRSAMEHPFSLNHWVARCDEGVSQPSINIPSIASLVNQIKQLGNEAKPTVQELQKIVNLEDAGVESDEKVQQDSPTQDAWEDPEEKMPKLQDTTTEDASRVGVDEEAEGSEGAKDDNAIGLRNNATCKELPSMAERVACICDGANSEKSVKGMGRECRARSVTVQTFQAGWRCTITRNLARDKKKRCAATMSWS